MRAGIGGDDLAALVLDGCDPRDVIGHDRFVNVIEDHVFGRWHQISGPVAPHRDGYEDGNRQLKEFDRRRRGRQLNELDGRRRQEVNGKGRRGRKAVTRICEFERGPIHIGQLLGCGRRHVIVDRREGGGRVRSESAQRQSAACVGGVGTMRIPAQIGPIGLLVVGRGSRAPDERLAPHREERPHARRHGIV
ncbi:MAG: hypothetical protein E6G96_02660 [Alphaproteobacteria bacterium]|nr:MAG: hypothetical protein E6G96_02660 [Alphaproteobacteria bacterium]